MLAALPDHPVLDVFYRTMIGLVNLGHKLGIFSDRCLHVKNMTINDMMNSFYGSRLLCCITTNSSKQRYDWVYENKLDQEGRRAMKIHRLYRIFAFLNAVISNGAPKVPFEITENSLDFF